MSRPFLTPKPRHLIRKRERALATRLLLHGKGTPGDRLICELSRGCRIVRIRQKGKTSFSLTFRGHTRRKLSPETKKRLQVKGYLRTAGSRNVFQLSQKGKVAARRAMNKILRRNGRGSFEREESREEYVAEEWS